MGRSAGRQDRVQSPPQGIQVRPQEGMASECLKQGRTGAQGRRGGGRRPPEGWVGALLKEAEEFGGLLTWWGGAYSTGRIFLQVSPCQGRRQRCVGGELTGYRLWGEEEERERSRGQMPRDGDGTEGESREETGHTHGEGKRRRGRDRHRHAETAERDREKHTETVREEGREIGDLGGRRPDPGGEGTRVRNRKAGTRVRDPQKQPGSAGHRPLRDEHRQTRDTQTQEVGGGGAGPESGGFPRRGGVSSPPQCPGGAPSQPPMLSGTQEGLSMLAAGGAPTPWKDPGVPTRGMQPPTRHRRV